MDILVTGGAGFIGSHFIQLILKSTDIRVTNIDALTYAGQHRSIQESDSKDRYRFIQADISNLDKVEEMVFDRHYDAIINFAAETHVDRSIQQADPFIQTNIVGTHELIKRVKAGQAKKMIQISTDEVYGSLQPGEEPFTELHPLSPNNPYSASKAGADLLVRSYYQTYELPLIITRCSNNYGPGQYPEKLIPKTIERALHDEAIPVYGSGANIRDWVYVEDHCRAIVAVMNEGVPGEIYNIGGSCEKSNLEVVRSIVAYLRKPESLINHVPDRLGHDFRYAMNWSKINRTLGWEPLVSFEEGIQKTLEWALQSQSKQ